MHFDESRTESVAEYIDVANYASSLLCGQMSEGRVVGRGHSSYRRFKFWSRSNLTSGVARHGVRSQPVPVALVGECSIPVVYDYAVHDIGLMHSTTRSGPPERQRRFAMPQTADANW